MEIREISKKYFEDWLNIGLELWSKYIDKKEFLRKEFEEIIASDNQTAFLYFYDNKLIGFVNVSLRFEYVQWAKSSPVWYIEWIFVKEEYRKKWISKALVEKARDWMILKKCKEIASDTDFDNITSQAFHKKLGFKESWRIVHFIKNI